jgi:hypothetical protein
MNRFCAWLRSDTNKRCKRQAGRRWYRPWAELLEDRALPSTVTWTNPAGGDWDTPGNWSTDAVPGPGDDVVIDLPGQNNFTVTHSANVADAVNSLTSQDALVLSGGSLSLAAASTMNNTLTISGASLIVAGDLAVSGEFTVDAGTLGGSGTVYVDGGTGASPNVIQNQLILNCALVNNGYTTTAGADIFLASGVTLTNATGATLESQDDSGILPRNGATGESFINDGAFLRTTTGYFAQNNVISVPLVNGPTGTVHLEANGITFSGGVHASGTPGATTFLADPGTNGITFSGATNNFDSSTSIVVSGAQFDGTTTIAGSYQAAGTGIGGNVSFTGSVNLAGSALFLGGQVDCTAATLVTPLDFSEFSGSGVFTSNADVHISGTFFTNSTTFAGSGTVYLDGGTPSNPNQIGNTLTLDRPLVNNGYTTTAGAGIFLASGVTLTNATGATLESQDDSGILPRNGATEQVTAGQVHAAGEDHRADKCGRAGLVAPGNGGGTVEGGAGCHNAGRVVEIVD